VWQLRANRNFHKWKRNRTETWIASELGRCGTARATEILDKVWGYPEWRVEGLLTEEQRAEHATA